MSWRSAFIWFLFFFFGQTVLLVGILVPWPGIELHPLQWKLGVLTIGLLGNSLICVYEFWYIYNILASFCSNLALSLIHSPFWKHSGKKGSIFLLLHSFFGYYSRKTNICKYFIDYFTKRRDIYLSFFGVYVST